MRFNNHGILVVNGKCHLNGKIKYPNALEAKMVLARAQGTDNPKRSSTERSYYQCQHCGYWHLSHLPWRNGYYQ